MVLPHCLVFAQSHNPSRRLALGLNYELRYPACLENRGTGGAKELDVRLCWHSTSRHSVRYPRLSDLLLSHPWRLLFVRILPSNIRVLPTPLGSRSLSSLKVPVPDYPESFPLGRGVVNMVNPFKSGKINNCWVLSSATITKTPLSFSFAIDISHQINFLCFKSTKIF